MEQAILQELDRKTLAPLLRAAAAEHFHTEVQNIQCLGGGSFGLAFRAELAPAPDVPRRVILKACRCPGMQETEAVQLRLLQAHTRVRMPEVYFVGSNFLCMEFIEGSNAMKPAYVLKSKQKRQDFAEQTVLGMLDWHAVHNNKFGYLENPEYDSWQAFYKPLAMEVLEKTKQLVDRGDYKAAHYETMARAGAAFGTIFREPVEYASLIHGDLNVMNIMVDPKSLNVTGFIDPFNSLWADREYDLFQLRNMTGDRFRLYQTYKEHTRVTELCDLKCAYYAVVNEALCYLRSGQKWGILFAMLDKRLRKELRKYGL